MFTLYFELCFELFHFSDVWWSVFLVGVAG